MDESQRILDEAIETWEPRAIVSLYSGGYDSLVATHLLHTLNTHGLDINVWSIDTNLAADGWVEYVKKVAFDLGWQHQIYNNAKGFNQFVTSVIHQGCPKSRKMHTFVYQKLKERAIDAIHMYYKVNRSNKTLFISGMRRAESEYRANSDEYFRVGSSNKIFCAPIVYWGNKDCDLYRIENDLPDNPFYDTVKGSGDCQCNWGDFITLEILKRYSPELAAGNVAMLDRLSKDLHGFGWHSKDVVGQDMLIEYDDIEDEVSLTTPFLCQDCSRSKIRIPKKNIEKVWLQRGLF